VASLLYHALQAAILWAYCLISPYFKAVASGRAALRFIRFCRVGGSSPLPLTWMHENSTLSAVGAGAAQRTCTPYPLRPWRAGQMLRVWPPVFAVFIGRGTGHRGNGPLSSQLLLWPSVAKSCTRPTLRSGARHGRQKSAPPGTSTPGGQQQRACEACVRPNRLSPLFHKSRPKWERQLAQPGASNSDRPGPSK
jgi:hypothetical protein